MFDPDTPHGAHNKSISDERYSLNLIIKPNEWLKEMSYDKIWNCFP